MYTTSTDVDQSRVLGWIGEKSLEDVEITTYIDIEAFHKFIQVTSGEGSDIGKVAGVSDQDIDWSEHFLGGGEGSIDSGGVGDISDVSKDLDTRVFGFNVFFGWF